MEHERDLCLDEGGCICPCRMCVALNGGDDA